VAVLLNWILAVFVVVNTWIDVGAATALQVSAYFVPTAIVSSFGLLLARKRPYQSKTLGGLSWLCVCAPLFWVVLTIAVM
jgi:hypothetical protein